MRVVHCKREAYTFYAGRPGPLGNPYRSGVHGTRAEVIAKFETYARQSEKILRLIYDLPEDTVLGCWCHPKPCHCHVIVQIWRELHGKT